MLVTNEIRRLRRKIELFDQEGFNEVLLDLIDEVTQDADLGVYGTKLRVGLINQLKSKYLTKIEVLTAPEKFKQTKLFKDEISGETPAVSG